jgi:hypothetical protein
MDDRLMAERDPMKADTIDEFFATLDENEHETKDTYPGSRHERRKPLPPAPVHTVEWDKNGYVKLIGGRKVEMFTIGALAKALRRSPNTLRSWIKLGYIPQAPYRLPSYEVNGKMVPGRRLYTRQMVESIMELFAERDLLTSKRVEWNAHKDLPGQIQSVWAALYEETSTPKEN